ncbi:MAG: hypothetical protein A2204_06860 [Elusimicrobia bacterium RIFOXYA1_FULL_47_7]|nr:MAG: hypothetical protein A2278_05360 [Elusimicrobia bacterium RIFOXYA12_FULL_49_49]OGS08014.1 MAG: hypothetical protein A2204_06860 [Elusimicrobia bacterium RIFOXYA1_FULL_47_7]OGS16495.1 MAG: hypothetical protein A2251_06700 [Elusimicrobia bacterium RIFOXYA2_FULL_47_53]OGS25890.1 MAG: hypothetical protein A2339_00715 [Elusimicrobia bacterium RIFOXYB12_FULL_50_12]OGS31232.1 MAG: hypothetical protein A2323_00985 [Elusimicrobia bacterium RIFOXYB2_FULL_46_23]
MIKDEIDLSRRIISPKQVVAYSKISRHEPVTVNLEPGLAIKSIRISELLSDCESACGFAVTLGYHLEEKIRVLLAQKNTVRALVLDAIGSVVAEELAELTNAQVKEDAARNGMVTTMRFSPGYGDWHLSGQKDFLAWLGAGQIGIKLTDNFQMLPEKSVSAIIGIKNKE